MAQETEAACLLRTGQLYPRRVGLKPAGGEIVFVGVKHGGFSLYHGDEPHYHLDLEGRWQRAYVGGTHYIKGIDGTVHALERRREESSLVLHRRLVGFIAAMDLDARVRQAAIDLLSDLGAGRLLRIPPAEGGQLLDDDELTDLLDRVTRWDTNTWFHQRELYHALLGAPPLLPPDAQHAVVLQASVFEPPSADGSGPPSLEPRPLDDFEDHARKVVALQGRRLAQCRRVFLAGDVLHLPLHQALGYFEAIARVFPLGDETAPARLSDLPVDAVRLGGIDVSLFDLRFPLPDRDGWKRLKAKHLGRVTLGVSSGDLEVRRDFGPSWSDPELRQTVTALKAAGVPVSLILLVGVGGALRPKPTWRPRPTWSTSSRSNRATGSTS